MNLDSGQHQNLITSIRVTPCPCLPSLVYVHQGVRESSSRQRDTHTRSHTQWSQYLLHLCTDYRGAYSTGNKWIAKAKNVKFCKFIWAKLIGSRYILRRPCRHCRRCRPVIKTSVDGLYSYNKYTKNLCKRTVFYFNLSSKTWSYNFTMCRPICGDCLCQRNIGWESLSRAHTGMCICVECTFVACF